MRAILFLLLSFAAVASTPSSSAGQAPHEAPVAIGEVHSVVLRGGGTVTVTPGQPALSYLKGDSRTARYRTENGTLFIDCQHPCPRADFRAAVALPRIASLAAERRGYIKTHGRFETQPRLNVSVRNGGRVDAYRIPAADVVASVTRGGQANVLAERTLTATVERGGEIQHWGGATVTSRIIGNGHIRQGD